ncbi:RNA-binding protein, putative [Phytophthora infestans T30-4]|uniref:RNA-binding protein, putative n=2 Tax=Phytophthora infestans TaxID=4787 RepID=D0NLD1_PHYIT|nr:RNA-binding protein, putative [Phytophthora infestans T30-4]EEY60449.1 RNA-binding protein, putative [Phytophthora infestans T30-4]KAF4034764.1 RNA recognition motif-containing protein [Phytophthora infestans]|eukprot:XP_002900245.1 RNA-binding protein, putative [Phytophthora infestans T30-4]
MADLDDEFARFTAEIQSLEQIKPTNDDEKIEAISGGAQIALKKAKIGLTAPPKPEVVMAKPKIYMAPPRPAPVKRTEDNAELDDGRSRLLNTLEDVAAHRGALSGFPVGTTGEHAATVSKSLTSASFRSMEPRLDMETGCMLPIAEQQMMNRQQSVYAYDPKRTAASIAAKDGAARGKKPKRNLRLAGGQVWEDPTLEEWPDNDFRLFCGDLGNEVSDELLAHSFSQYASFQRARVVRDKLTHKSRGYGFVSFADPFDCAKALREMNGKYIGNRPVKLSKSKWQERNMDVAKKKLRKRKRDKHHLFN